jgi:hypothetical protein
LRHYNKETGIQGAQYEQKTSKAVCDEMKEDSYMETYVMEAGVLSRCVVSSEEGCSDKEKEYISKYRGKDIAEAVEQSGRLAEMAKTKGAKQSVTGYKWLAARRAILKQITSQPAAGSADL